MVRIIKRMFCDCSSGKLLKRYYKQEKLVKIYQNGHQDVEHRVKAIKKYKCRKCGKIYNLVIKSQTRPFEYMLGDFINELEYKGYERLDWSD